MRFNRLDLNLLVALDALLVERSITKAAERLNLSPSATSNALSRLREYFDDELLVQVGRRMEPTPRAQGLQDAVRDVLVRVDSAIAIQPNFDPATSDRVFRIFVSDYTQMVLLPHVLTLADAARCTARFEFLPQVSNPVSELERGEAMRASGLPERSARRVLGELVGLGLLASETPKGKVSLRFPAHALEDLFPKLYPQS